MAVERTATPSGSPSPDEAQNPRDNTADSHDSEATEDEFTWEAELLSPSSRDGDGASKPKRPRGRRALKQLLEDRTAPASKPLAPHDAAIKAAIRRGQQEGERLRRRSVPTPRFGIQHSTVPALHLERDTAIMQLVLEKRPFLIHRSNGERELLEVIVRALKPNGVWAMTTESVQRQIKWLAQVWLEEDHADHANLMAATELQAMVTQYYETSDRNLKDLLERINADAVRQPSEITFDDVLLLEVLQRRPFEARKGRMTAAVVWDELVAALNDRLGVNVFFSGSSCKDRVARLRAVARGTRQDPLVELTEAQRRMLADLEDVGTPAKKQRHSRGPNEALEPEEIHYSSFATEDEESEDDQKAVRTKKRAHSESSDGTAVEFVGRTATPDATTPESACGLQHLVPRTLDVLLKETVRVRPFFGAEREMALWGDIVASVNQSAGAEVFVNAAQCRAHIVKLVESHGAPVPPEFVPLTDGQRDLLRQIDWPGRTQTVRRKPTSKRQRPGLTSVNVNAKREEATCSTTQKKAVPIYQHQHEVQRDPQVPQHLHAAANTLAKALETRNEHLEGLITRERSEFDAERAMLRQRVTNLEENVHTLHVRLQAADQTTASWIQRLDDERRQHHTQLETLITMLKTEREAQRLEVRAALDAIAAERREQLQSLGPLPALRDHNAYTVPHQHPYDDEITQTTRHPDNHRSATPGNGYIATHDRMNTR